MIEKEINGQRYLCFEESEREAKRFFEKTMYTDDAIRRMTVALMDAISEMEMQKREAWDSLHEGLPEKYKIELKGRLEYCWLHGGFKLLKED